MSTEKQPAQQIQAEQLVSHKPEATIAAKASDVSSKSHEPKFVSAERRRIKITGHKHKKAKAAAKEAKDKSFNDLDTRKAYDSIPLLEIDELPRGGVSLNTEAVGRIQFGIPPETIKDSMRLGLSVPTIYIVPVDRFCREMGPALGVNLAEFEFPAYFNFFVLRKQCTLVVDSDDAEKNIRRVFNETLLGPAQFRRKVDNIDYEEEDFSPDYNPDARPNFQKELKHFRIMPDGKELVLETLLKFRHFNGPYESSAHGSLGVPPPLENNICTNKSTAGTEKVGADVVGLDSYGQVDCAMSTSSDPSDNAVEASSNFTSNKQVSLNDNAETKESKSWAYSEIKSKCNVSTVYPDNATPEQITKKAVKHVEIFKMHGGTEYIVHDIDQNNIIVGKARFSGNLKVSEFMSVDGFGGRDFMADMKSRRRNSMTCDDNGNPEDELDKKCAIPKSVLPPTFHPPSFGVTVLGNSHGFDKSGSVSGYVLWINGRGVMIDPPPYSSATLEREGIRPRNIVGIILTHCHADHDAGAFQKVLTGNKLVIITTPTIYKSFIRKYAALSSLSPALLRHSHRHKSAIIGTPLRFQGATFHFRYTLHTIPCIGFKVEWRGRSMVFTGDHFNDPEALLKLEESGVLSKGRADDLRNLPLEETDLLLHEAGAPPIHTPLEVLLKLPKHVKDRLFVVHTSALPKDCELRAAPTGTAGTIRLDALIKPFHRSPNKKSDETIDQPMLGESEYHSNQTDYKSSSRFESSDNEGLGVIRQRHAGFQRMNSLIQVHASPLVSLRPTSSTDAWFILNLLSAVPFLSSLSYAYTMEVLEEARVDAKSMFDVVVPANRREEILCVIWEGTCMEREQNTSSQYENQSKSSQLQIPLNTKEARGRKRTEAVWHAGDWTGPRSLQPDKRLSGESSTSATHDIVAMSSQGVKVITVEISHLKAILKNGSSLYRKYLERRTKLSHLDAIPEIFDNCRIRNLFEGAVHNLNVIELIDCNSALRKITAVQKRHLECLAEGPTFYNPGQRLWRSGAPVDKAFIVVAGTVSVIPKRRNAGPVRVISNQIFDKKEIEGLRVGLDMGVDAIRAMRELGREDLHTSDSSISSGASESDTSETNETSLNAFFSEHSEDDAVVEANDYEKLSRRLQKRADSHHKSPHQQQRRDSSSTDADCSLQYYTDSSMGDDGTDEIEVSVLEEVFDGTSIVKEGKFRRRRSSRDRITNKVLGRMFSRHAVTDGLVFSRGHFLCDVSKMVPSLISDNLKSHDHGDDTSIQYGFGEKTEEDVSVDISGCGAVGELVIHETETDKLTVHNSTLAAGKDGCVVMVFPKSSLIPFLDEYPGLLLSLLGTQVVV